MAESDLGKVLKEFETACCDLCHMDTNNCQCTEEEVIENEFRKLQQAQKQDIDL